MRTIVEVNVAMERIFFIPIYIPLQTVTCIKMWSLK